MSSADDLAVLRSQSTSTTLAEIAVDNSRRTLGRLHLRRRHQQPPDRQVRLPRATSSSCGDATSTKEPAPPIAARMPGPPTDVCNVGSNGNGAGWVSQPVGIAVDPSAGPSSGDRLRHARPRQRPDTSRSSDPSGHLVTGWGGTPFPGAINGADRARRPVQRLQPRPLADRRPVRQPLVFSGRRSLQIRRGPTVAQLLRQPKTPRRAASGSTAPATSFRSTAARARWRRSAPRAPTSARYHEL